MTTRIWLALRGRVQGHFSCQGTWRGEPAVCVSTAEGDWADPGTYQVQLVPLNPLPPATVLLLPLLHAHKDITFPGDQRLQ